MTTLSTANWSSSTACCSAVAPCILFVIWPPITGEVPPENRSGEMAEWSKARAWKVRIPVKGYRGFESLSLRHCTYSGEAHLQECKAPSLRY